MIRLWKALGEGVTTKGGYDTSSLMIPKALIG